MWEYQNKTSFVQLAILLFWIFSQQLSLAAHSIWWICRQKKGHVLLSRLWWTSEFNIPYPTVICNNHTKCSQIVGDNIAIVIVPTSSRSQYNLLNYGEKSKSTILIDNLTMQNRLHLTNQTCKQIDNLVYPWIKLLMNLINQWSTNDLQGHL